MQRAQPDSIQSKWDELPTYLEWEGGFSNPFIGKRPYKEKKDLEEQIRVKFNREKGHEEIDFRSDNEDKDKAKTEPDSPRNRTRSFAPPTPEALEIKRKLTAIELTVRDQYDELKKLPQLDQQLLVDSLLLRLAGIHKAHSSYKKYKDIPYPALVICMLDFLDKYTDPSTGLDKLTFSGLQIKFEIHLSKLDAEMTKMQQKKNPDILEAKVAPPPQPTPLPISDEPHLNGFQQLCHALSSILRDLCACLSHLKMPSFSFFSRTSGDQKDDGMDHKHIEEEMKPRKVDSNSINL